MFEVIKYSVIRSKMKKDGHFGSVLRFDDGSFLVRGVYENENGLNQMLRDDTRLWEIQRNQNTGQNGS